MARELVEFRPQVYTVLPTDTTDERLVELWLHDLASTIQESYYVYHVTRQLVNRLKVRPN